MAVLTCGVWTPKQHEIRGAPYLKVSQSKWGQTVAKVKLKRSQSVDILTLATVWPLYPDLSLCLALLSTVYSQFIQAYPHIIITLSAVTHVSHHALPYTSPLPVQYHLLLLPHFHLYGTLTTLPYHMLLTWLKQFVYQPFSTIPYCPRLPSCQKKFKYDYKHVRKFCSSIHPTLVQTKHYEWTVTQPHRHVK